MTQTEETTTTQYTRLCTLCGLTVSPGSLHGNHPSSRPDEVAQRRADIAQIVVDIDHITPDEVAWLSETDSVYANASHHGNGAFSTWADAARAVALLREERRWSREYLTTLAKAGEDALMALRADLEGWLTGMDDEDGLRYEVADSRTLAEDAVASFRDTARSLLVD